MSTYYVDRNKAAYSLEGFNVGPWDVRVEETPERLFVAPTSTLDVEDIFLSYSYDGDTGPLWVTVNFLEKEDFDALIKTIGASEYLKAGRAAWSLIPSQYKTPAYVLGNAESFQDIQLEYLERTGTSAQELTGYVQSLLSDPAYYKLFEATGGGGGSIRFLGDNAMKIADAITGAYPGYSAKGLYKDNFGIEMNALDFIYFRKSTTSSTGGPSTGDLFALTGTPGFGNAADTITDFNPKENDKLQIDLSTFEGAIGKLNIAKKSKQVAKLAKKDVDFIYDQQAGNLYYNENGKQPGFGDGGIFAILEGKPKAGLGNFEFI
jgi:hypothetical protein